MLKSGLYWLGVGYVVVVPLTTIVGYSRFESTKLILGLSDISIFEHFGTLGISVQACLLGVVLALTVGCYWGLGDVYIFGRR